MTSHEFIGKSVKEAISKACEDLQAAEADLDIEVLEESTRGFLGIVGQRDARIRVTLKEVVEDHTELQSQTEAWEEEPGFGRRSSANASQSETLMDSENLASSEAITPEQSIILEQGRTVLEEILKRIPVDVEVRASASGDAITLNIIGDGSGLLIGKRGQTLDALQFLMNKIINKDCPPGSKAEIVVDSEQYRHRKNELLRETAQRMSQKAKRTLKPVSLNPMSPSERRIVHLILAEDNEVYTKSYGEGMLRRIIVYPRRGVTNKRRRR
jgi:spoIIIJ-associated protein